MRELFFFATIASLSLTVFIVSLIELYFTRHRRRMHEDLENKVKEIKAHYNEEINRVVLDDGSKLEEAEKKVTDLTVKEKQEKKALEEAFAKKLADSNKESQKEIEEAKSKSKALQQEAKLKADEYMKSRQKEVEADLMDLVLTVTKKVLPKGMTYQVQKDLVLQALQDIKKEEVSS